MRARFALLAAATLLAGCASGEAKGEGAAPPGSDYVAMGSSFAAGPGLGPPKPGTPERCTRSAVNYPSLLAEEAGLSLDDQSCSGATTAHILAPWNELPAQIDAVTADTRLVTVTIGGNNLNYVGNLFAASCMHDQALSGDGAAADCQTYALPGPEDYAQLESNLRKVADAVRGRAPEATLVFVQYVRLVPDTSCASTPLADDKLGELRELGEKLAEVTAKVARETGSKLLEADALSRGHTPCDAEPWATGFPAGYDGSEGAPWHPNARGMRGVADALVQMLDE